MLTRSTFNGLHVACIVVILVTTNNITATAQKLKLAVRTGVSMANFTGHNNSISNPGAVILNAKSSFYELNYIQPGGTYEYPQFYYKTSTTKDLRMGFYGGIFLDIALTKRLSLEPGISYVQKGIDLNYSQASATGNTQNTYSFRRSINTDYISIPVVVKYYVDRHQHFYVAAGIYDAFAVKTKIKDATSTHTTTTTLESGFPTFATSTYTWTAIDTRVIDCGLVGGLGFNLPVSSRFSLGIDARVNVGMVNVKGNSSDASYLNFSSSTKNINLEAGLRAAYTLSAQ